MIVSIWRNLWRLSVGKKSTSSPIFFLEILQGYCKQIGIFGALGMPRYACPKLYYQHVKTSYVYLQAKN